MIGRHILGLTVDEPISLTGNFPSDKHISVISSLIAGIKNGIKLIDPSHHFLPQIDSIVIQLELYKSILILNLAKFDISNCV